MYILTTATQNIRRYAGRYALFGVLVFVVLAIGAVTLATVASLDAYLDAQTEKYGCTVLVTESGGTLTRDEIREVGKMSAVKERVIRSFSFGVWAESITTDGQSIDLAALKGSAESRKAVAEAGIALLLSGEPKPQIYVQGADYTAEEYDNPEVQAALLKAGRLPTASGEAMLVEGYGALFGFDGAGIGSTITLAVGEFTRDFTVVGILAGNGKDGSRYTPIYLTVEDAMAFDVTRNLVDYLIEGQKARNPGAMRFETDDYLNYDCLFILVDTDRFPTFRRKLGDVAAKIAANTIDPNKRAPSFDVTRYYPGGLKLSTAFEATDRIAAFFMTAVIAIAAAVILIMTALGMHERKYEIGVLLSVGMEKWRIALLFAAENLVFTLGVTVLAYLVGLIVAPWLAETLLAAVVAVSRIAAAWPVAWRMVVLAVGLSIPASLLSGLSILIFKPMTILRSRT